MSEFAVERARQMFQARKSRQATRQAATPSAGRRGDKPPARTTRSGAVGAAAETDTTAGDPPESLALIGELHLIHSRLRQLDGRLRDEHKLNLTEMHVLSRIPAARQVAAGGDHAALLAQAVELSPSGLTRLVDRLVDRGLLARVDDAWDKRVTHLVLTERGMAVRDAVLPRAVDQILDTCGKERGLLDRLRRNGARLEDRPDRPVWPRRRTR